MKASSVVALVLGLASSVLAAPGLTEQIREEHAKKSLFIQGDNLVNISDSTTCIVSSAIDGGNRICHGNGTATTKDGVSYNYTYDTNQDGTINATISLEGGRSCTYNLKTDGKLVTDVIHEAAEKCAKKT